MFEEIEWNVVVIAMIFWIIVNGIMWKIPGGFTLMQKIIITILTLPLFYGAVYLQANR